MRMSGRLNVFAVAVAFIALLAFGVVCGRGESAFAQGTATAAAAEATEGPTKLTVGVLVVKMTEPDLRSRSYEAIFWLWFRWKGNPDLQPLKTFEIIGGQVEANENELRETIGDETYTIARIRATLSQPFDVSRFPLDRHELQIVIEETSAEVDTIEYVADAGNSRLESIRLEGWKIGEPTSSVMTKEYESNFGDPRLESNNKTGYARFIFSIPVERPGIGYPIKLFWTLYLSAFIAFIANWIKPIDLDPRFGLGIGAVFAAMASAFVVSASLPDGNQVTIADKVVIATIGFIVVSVVASIVSLRLFQAGKEEASKRLDLAGFFVLLVGYIGVNAIMLSN